MAGIPSHKYDLLPYSTTISTPSTSSAHNYTHHRPSKREYIESSDVEDVPSSPPRKIRARPKRRVWRDSSDIGYSSDVDEDDRRVLFEDGDAHIRRRTRTVAGGENMEEMFISSQASQENSTSKFHRILSNAIMDGLDSLDFSDIGLYELPWEIGEAKHLVRSSALQSETSLIPQLKVYLGPGNLLKSLPFELFTLSNLTVLSLRKKRDATKLILGNNNLKYIPEAIGNLSSLWELNIAGNQLSFLPHTVLNLKNLQHLRLHPNPFLPPPDSYSPLPTPPSSQIKSPAILRAHQSPHSSADTSLVPSLLEYTSRTLGKNFILMDIDKAWELPEHLRNKALHAEEQHKWDDTCAMCGTWYVDGPSDVDGTVDCLEWYDTLHGNDAVPIRRGLCSWGCIIDWNRECEQTLGERTQEPGRDEA